MVHRFVCERFGLSLCRSSCLNYLHRLGFAFKRPRKHLVKADEAKREPFVAEYPALRDEAGRIVRSYGRSEGYSSARRRSTQTPEFWALRPSISTPP